ARPVRGDRANDVAYAGATLPQQEVERTVLARVAGGGAARAATGGGLRARILAERVRAGRTRGTRCDPGLDDDHRRPARLDGERAAALRVCVVADRAVETVDAISA